MLSTLEAQETNACCTQESIPVGCVPPTSADRTCFNSHEMSVLGVDVPEVNKFEQVMTTRCH